MATFAQQNFLQLAEDPGIGSQLLEDFQPLWRSWEVEGAQVHQDVEEASELSEDLAKEFAGLQANLEAAIKQKQQPLERETTAEAKSKEKRRDGTEKVCSNALDSSLQCCKTNASRRA